MKLALFDTKPYDREAFQEVNNQYNYEITYFKYHLTEQTVELTKGFEAVCVFVNDTLSRVVIDKLWENGVKIVALRCAGYNNVDREAARGKLAVVRVPSYSPHAIAEHALALILSLNRKIHRAYFRTRDNNFTINGLLGFDLYGRTAGIIGTGKIGLTLIDILKGLGMEVLAYDAYPRQEEAEKRGFSYVPLEELFERSRIISLHCPLTPETHHMINRDTISLMQDDVMIINTGRGQLIDTKALIAGLKRGKVGSAGLDVYEEEEHYFFEDHSQHNVTDDVLARLLTFHNVLVTSHQAFFTKDAIRNIVETTFRNLEDYREGKALVNRIE
ncbi:MAG: 2-hydroxyacid dehydrogenase [Spirochaetales bacterium]|nr:2-hydroxyacid dehydrogenase [Spirochaetales bacterium]